MLKPRQALHREAAEIISERIIKGHYPSNTFLPPERELCRQMGVSRTVVREAIKVLESMGMIRIDRGRGTAVLEARPEAVSRPLKILLRRGNDLVEHLLEARKVLEVGLVGLAAERRSDENLAAMQNSLEIMRQKPDRPEGYIDADLEFHAEIARAAKNPVFSILLEPLRELLRESRIASFSGPNMVRIRTRQHEEIFELIRRGDARAAQDAMRIHLSGVQQDLEKNRKRIKGKR
jgi:GntR family transcriptional repressor for pyruvate dehydrogenase complex